MILHLLGSRGLPTFLFGVMALLAGTAAARSTSPSDFIFHLLAAALWVMFAVLVGIVGLFYAIAVVKLGNGTLRM